MILFDFHELNRFRPMQNFVLTTTVLKADVIRIGELELYQDTSYNPGMHQPIVQKVVKTPKNLSFGRVRRFIELDKGNDLREIAAIDAPVPHSMPWKTTMDVKRDDIVYVDSFTLATAAKENRLIESDGIRYYLIPYSDIYFRLIEGTPEMINGWMLVQPIDQPQDKTMAALKAAGFVFPGVQITNDNRRELGVGDKLGIVRHIGLPVDEYLEDMEETDEVNVGDTVIFKWQHNRRLENGGARFFGDTELIVTRRPRIVGKMSMDLF